MSRVALGDLIVSYFQPDVTSVKESCSLLTRKRIKLTYIIDTRSELHFLCVSVYVTHFLTMTVAFFGRRKCVAMKSQ